MMYTSAFARYSLPTDDLIYHLNPSLTSADIDPAYPFSNWQAFRQSKPVKLLTANGRIVLDAGAAVNVAAVALHNHNFDENFPVYLEWNSANAWNAPIGSLLIPVPAVREDGWTTSPWMPVPNSPTYRYWSLVFGGSGSPLVDNSQAISLGRWALLGALRTITTDARYGLVEEEESRIIEHETDLEVETIYEDLDSPRRSFVGELPYMDDEAADFIGFCRATKRRIRPWTLIPDVNVNDACFVRFIENKWSRTIETIGANIFPYRVKELSRGLPWP